MNFCNKRNGLSTLFYLNNSQFNVFQTSKTSDLKLIFIIEFMRRKTIKGVYDSLGNIIRPNDLQSEN